jgi:DNA-binding NtrC family response regulator
MTNRKLVIGEDDRAVRSALCEYLRSLKYDVTEATSCDSIKEAFRDCGPAAAVLDYSLPDGTALDLLPQLKQSYPSVPVILLTGKGTIPLAVQAMKEGAEQFLTKPVPMESIAVALERALADPRRDQNRPGSKRNSKQNGIDPFWGKSEAIRRVAEHAERVCRSQCPVLITGETGTGKGVLANWLHTHSLRAAEPFVDLNCAGLGKELVETELFGHEAGAFTGAVQRKLGLMEIAERGTVFLDEIGDMDLQVQPKLLKVLEEKKFRRLGDIQERHLDIRLIAASHQDLGQLVRQNRFRSDLYFRVSTVVIRVPPLRQRRDDIPLLVEHFFQRAAADLARPSLAPARRTMEKIVRYPWPGNIRELKNAIERAALLAPCDRVAPEDLHLDFGEGPPNNSEESWMTLREIDRLHIHRALAAEHGNISRAAVRLGVSRASLYNKLKTLAISRSQH